MKEEVNKLEQALLPVLSTEYIVVAEFLQNTGALLLQATSNLLNYSTCDSDVVRVITERSVQKLCEQFFKTKGTVFQNQRNSFVKNKGIVLQNKRNSLTDPKEQFCKTKGTILQNQRNSFTEPMKQFCRTVPLVRFVVIYFRLLFTKAFKSTLMFA